MKQKEKKPMLRFDNSQQSIWDSILPPDIFRMSEELEKVDMLLSDDRFLTPFRDKFYTRVGRPTTPIATYLRMMYLKRRYNLGYEILVKEVKDSFTWRRFCHLSLEDRVPDSTTLIKLTKKYGEATVQALHNALMLKLKEDKVIRGKKLRIDTAVVESDIHYPTDTGLLADGIRVITRAVSNLKKQGIDVGDKIAWHTRKVKRICLGLTKVLKKRTGKDKTELNKARKALIKIARNIIVQGREIKERLNVLTNKKPKVERLAEQLGTWLEATEKVTQQTESVIAGVINIPQRTVSLFDLGARPIRKGKMRVDTEFGHKVLIGETDHGVITVYKVLEDNPADATLLKSVIHGHKHLFRKRLKSVAADRAFYSGNSEMWLKKIGVSHISIPGRGKISKERKAYQRQSWFKRLQRFRAGIEARISLLKRKYGLRRSMMRGNSGTEIWVGQGIFAHNLWKASQII